MAEPPKRPTRPSQAVRGSTATGRPSVAGRTSQVDRALALRDAVAQAVESEKSFRKKTTIKVSRARLRAMMVVAVPLVALSIYSWVARPAFIWGPPPPAPTPAQADANLRAALYFLGMRIDAYRREQGFYPASLEAMGESFPGVLYEVLSDSVFELRGVVNRRVVIFRSDMSPEEYLGDTKNIIAGRARKR
jgi:hypothetical protein